MLTPQFAMAVAVAMLLAMFYDLADRLKCYPAPRENEDKPSLPRNRAAVSRDPEPGRVKREKFSWELFWVQIKCAWIDFKVRMHWIGFAIYAAVSEFLVKLPANIARDIRAIFFRKT